MHDAVNVGTSLFHFHFKLIIQKPRVLRSRHMARARHAQRGHNVNLFIIVEFVRKIIYSPLLSVIPMFFMCPLAIIVRIRRIGRLVQLIVFCEIQKHRTSKHAPWQLHSQRLRRQRWKKALVGYTARSLSKLFPNLHFSKKQRVKPIVLSSLRIVRGPRPV